MNLQASVILLINRLKMAPKKRSGRPPLNSPLFNLREISKQMILLEDHLSDDEKFCPDCIRKHMLTIEALAEEALMLDESGKFSRKNQTIARNARRWMTRFSDGVDKRTISQQVRKDRKALVEISFDPRG